MALIRVKLRKVNSGITPNNLSQHYAAWQYISARALSQLFSALTMGVSIDALAKRRLNDARAMSKSQGAWQLHDDESGMTEVKGTDDHSSNSVTSSGKLGLFSVLDVGPPPACSPFDLASALPGQVSAEEREVHSGNAHGPVHDNTLDPESTVRNLNDMLEFWDRFASLYLDAGGELKPNLVMLADNGHGPGELLFRFHSLSASSSCFAICRACRRLRCSSCGWHFVIHAGGQSLYNVVE